MFKWKEEMPSFVRVPSISNGDFVLTGLPLSITHKQNWDALHSKGILNRKYSIFCHQIWQPMIGEMEEDICEGILKIVSFLKK